MELDGRDDGSDPPFEGLLLDGVGPAVGSFPFEELLLRLDEFEGVWLFLSLPFEELEEFLLELGRFLALLLEVVEWFLELGLDDVREGISRDDLLLSTSR